LRKISSHLLQGSIKLTGEILEMIKPDLQKIFKGEMYSSRRVAFLKGGKQRDQLKYSPGTSVLVESQVKSRCFFLNFFFSSAFNFFF